MRAAVERWVRKRGMMGPKEGSQVRELMIRYGMVPCELGNEGYAIQWRGLWV